MTDQQRAPMDGPFESFAHLTGEGRKFRDLFEPFIGVIQREPSEIFYVVSQGGRDVFLLEGDIDRLLKLRASAVQS